MKTRTTTRHRLAALALSGSVAGLLQLVTPGTADACGCFVPPDPTVPIVQAGERILFAMDDGVVTAHVQIQYSGDAKEFGWLLPLPSVPEFAVGTDELFTQLINTTQPKYRLTYQYEGNCPFNPNDFTNFGGAAGAGGDSAAPSEDGDDRGESVLVVEDTVGPYSYAVLRADSKQPMLDWLNEHHYFVPAGTDDVVDPYIKEGAYFLALKLVKGKDVGDLQPVVLKYQSDLPMIPIVLTSVAADPDMGVMVWMLGNGRAIPRNYHHTLINDAKVDWINAGANYVSVINAAVDEAPGDHHSFVTEYAGTSSIMQNLLDFEGRFGDKNDLRAIQDDPAGFVEYLLYNGFAPFTSSGGFGGFGGQSFPSQLIAILQQELPLPAVLATTGITANDYYVNMRYYLEQYRMNYPRLYQQFDLEYDAVKLTREIWERIVTPTLEAGALFKRHEYMTRLFTTLSPDEMTADPVFSFNPDLPDVSNVHEAVLTYYCNGSTNDDITTTPAVLTTPTGWSLPMVGGTANNPWLTKVLPSSYHTEILREEGSPEIVIDNTAMILAAISGEPEVPGSSVGNGGCAVTSHSRTGLGGLLALLFVAAPAMLLTIRRRRAK